MAATADVPFDPSLLRLGPDLRRLGIEPSRQAWHSVRRGVWVPSSRWASLRAGQRYEALVHATVLQCRTPEEVVVAGPSAAALWGLPRIEPWPDHVVVLDAEATMGASRFIRPRHGAPVVPMVLRGVRVTPVPRTLADLGSAGTLETAVAAADAALRRRLCTLDDLTREVAALPAGSKGRRKARLMVDLADGRSGSTGESLSRVQMFRANLPRPRLQTEFSDAQGRIGFVDFEWQGLIGEFDGRVKDKVPSDATPQEAGEIVWREKLREDRLRRHKPVTRWVWATAKDTSTLARHLMAAGLRPEPRSTWIPVGQRAS
jgi:hypothetical protein